MKKWKNPSANCQNPVENSVANSVEIDNKGNTNKENMRQSENKFSRYAKAKTKELPNVKQTLVSIFLVSVNIRSDQ